MIRGTVLQRVGQLAGALLATVGLVAGIAALSVVHAYNDTSDSEGDCTVAAAEIRLDAEESTIHRSITAYRHENGLPSLAADATLTKAALWASADSAKRGVAPTDHIDTLNRDIPSRLRDCGYTTFTWVSENNYAGYGTRDDVDLAGAQGAFAFWRNSPTHNANILDTRARYVGIARVCAGATCYWTLNFGSDYGGADFTDLVPPGPTPSPVPTTIPPTPQGLRWLRLPAPATGAAYALMMWMDTDNEDYYKVTVGCGNIRFSDIYPYAAKDELTWSHSVYLYGGVDGVCSDVGDIVYELQACNSAGCSAPATLTRPPLR